MEEVPPPVVPQKKSKKKSILALLAITIFIFALVIVLFEKINAQFVTQKVDQNNNVTIATPTPFPFEEMTIPYLRSRGYDSVLTKPELISQNSNYNSYLTSYSSDGLKINAQLTIPNGDRPIEGYPAVIFIHGYIPPTLYQTLSNYTSYVDYLASNGFVVLKVDLRGHADSEGTPSGAYYSSDYIIDVLNAYYALQNEEDISPNAIGLWGHSMAGNVALRTLAARPDIPAVVIWAGAVYTYSDWKKYGIDDGSYRPPENITEHNKGRKELYAAHGEFDPNSPFWRTVVATNYLKDIKGAIQLNHAIDDAVVNIGYSRDLIKLLKEAGIENEIHEYPSGGHNITGANYNPAMQNSVEFFKKYLK